MVHTCLFLLRQNKFEEALKAIEEAISISMEVHNNAEVHEEYIELYLVKGKIFTKLRQFNEALECLSKALYNRCEVF